MEIVIGGIALRFETKPGLFSPSHPDRGTLAMLAVTSLRPEEKILDLGCGYGLVGIYMAKLVDPERVVMSDVDPVAVEQARQNAEANGVGSVRIYVSDGFQEVSENDFTLIMSNPPYHSDFAVAKRFIEGAVKHLVVGGRLVMVVKRVTWYANKMRNVFGGVRVTHKDTYAVLESEKRRERPGSRPSTKTTKKHLRRVEMSARKNPRRRSR